MKYLIMFMFLCSTCFAQDLTSATLNDVAAHGGPIRCLGLVGPAPLSWNFMVGDSVKVGFAQGRTMQNMVQTMCNTYNIPYERATSRYYGLTTAQKRTKYVFIQFEKNQGMTEQQCFKVHADYTEALTTNTLTSVTLQAQIDTGLAANALRKQYEEGALILFPD